MGCGWTGGKSQITKSVAQERAQEGRWVDSRACSVRLSGRSGKVLKHTVGPSVNISEDYHRN